MAIENLMRHTADVYRPAMIQRTGQEIEGYTRVYRSVPCFIQPGGGVESFYYQERGQENPVQIYTSRTDLAFQRNDVFLWDGREFHVTGQNNGLYLDVYQSLTAVEYPEGAKKRLSAEDYPE